METRTVRLSHRLACLYWASWYGSHSVNGIVYAWPGEASEEKMLLHFQATTHGAMVAPCSRITLPSLVPTDPVPVARPAPPPRHITPPRLPQEGTNGTDGTRRTHTPPPLQLLVAEGMGKRAGPRPHRGHSQSPTLLAAKLKQLPGCQLIF